MSQDLSTIEIITLIIALIGLILSILNAVRSIFHERRYKYQLKINLKMRSLKEWFDIAKDFVKRVDFTNIESTNTHKNYYYEIKKENNDEYLDLENKKGFIHRYEYAMTNFTKFCQYPEETAKLSDIPRLLDVNKNMDLDFISYPLPLDPGNEDKVKEEFLEDVRNHGQMNGLKIKDFRWWKIKKFLGKLY